MSFLQCTPCVFVIGKEYEILVHAKTKGIFSVVVGGEEYDPANSGVLSSEKTFAKIRVPQSALNEAKGYEVVFRETINRKGYFSRIAEPQTESFAFKPLEKTENINIYHVADVHYNYEIAAQAAKYFGEDIDLFVVNGDIGEVETEQNYLETSAFVGQISEGKIPVLFSRGNHDTRGKLAERYVEYFPCNGVDTYYSFEIGCLCGFVLDCGEDKKDDYYDEKYEYPWVYGGVNKFHAFRQRELKWLQSQELPKDKIRFAVSHICPAQACSKKWEGSVFDIERECYGKMNAELTRTDIAVMLCGHIHDAYVIRPNDGQSYIPHTYPVVVGSKLLKTKYIGGKAIPEKYYGAAIILNKDQMSVKFVDQNFEACEEHVISFTK